MKKIAPILVSLALFSSSLNANPICVGYYKGGSAEAQINYQEMMQQLLLSLPIENRIAILKQVHVAQSGDISFIKPTEMEVAFFTYMAKAKQAGEFDAKFDEVVEKLFQLPQIQAKAKDLPPKKKAEMVAMLKGGILGEIQLRHYYSKSFGFDIWGAIAKNLTKVLNKVKDWFDFSPEKKLQKIAELINENDLGKVQLAGTKDFEFLIDGPMAFAKREELISRAKKSIHVLTWSIYDDATGTKFATDLINAKARNKELDIKIIVDALTAQKEGHNAQIQRMIDAGIEVIFSKNPNLALSGQHRKAMIIDGAEVIAGGMNYGDVYSHMAGNVKWRDTDVYFTGSLAHQTENSFRTEWNEQIYFGEQTGNVLPFSRMEKIDVIASDNESTALMISSNPASKKDNGSLKGSPILASLLALIKSAKDEIIIENAYVISNPIFETTLKEAIDRGVKVTIITNSNKSVDVPEIANPILASALRLKKLGAQIVLKKGDTLHSKVALFDGKISFVTSYNIHPRSEIIEDEVAYIFTDRKEAKKLERALRKDIRNNHVIVTDSEIEFSNDPLMMFVNRIFYNQL